MMSGRMSAVRSTLIVIVAWTAVALAWTPPTALVGQLTAPPSLQAAGPVFLFVFLGFVPWMVATPPILRLGRYFPIAEGHLLPNLAIHAAAGILIIPVVTLIGTASATLLVPPPGETLRLRDFVNPVVITSLYSVPTYVAVVGIGQALGYFERYRARERLLARAELGALQAQLRPHFLFNALNAIAALGYRDPALADAALARLADLLRALMAARPHEIPLRDEIAFVRDYAELHRMLMRDRLGIDFEIPADAWNLAVPAMLLQPLVENAIRHGIARRNEGGRVEVSAAVVERELRLAVRNDAPEDDAPPVRSGVGFSNVVERLRVLYGARAEFCFSRGRSSALATVRLPLRSLAPAE